MAGADPAAADLFADEIAVAPLGGEIDRGRRPGFGCQNLARENRGAEMAAGRGHTVVWNGRDDHDRPVGSGVYFCSLDAPDGRQSRKIVVMR